MDEDNLYSTSPVFHTETHQLPLEDDDATADVLENDLNSAAVNYYAILNVSNTATDEDIKDSYKRLCRTFHPDKHVNPEDSKAAETKFQSIQRAYEVLTTPARRAAYDLYGEEGLQTGWEVGPRLKTPQEIREEYERLSRQKREQQLENLVKAKATIQVDVDATQAVHPYDRHGSRLGLKERMSQMDVTQFLMKHSFDSQLGDATYGTVTGHMFSRNGVGKGNILGTVRHTFSPTFWAQATVSVMSPRVLHLKTMYNVSSDSFIQVECNTQTVRAPPTVNITAGRRLTANSTGYMVLRSGQYAIASWGSSYMKALRREYSAVAIGISAQNSLSNYTIELQTGLVSSHLTFQYGYNWNKDITFRASTVLSTGGLNASVGVDRKITEHAKLGMSVDVGIPEGVSIKLKFSRLGQRLNIPILLSRDLALDVAFFALVIPTCGLIAVEQTIMRPRKVKKMKQRIAELRERHAEYLETRKRDALDSVRLMRDGVLRRTEQEELKNGLVIMEATYGNLTSPETSIDVTIAVQALINNSQLRISGGHSKSNIIGFYDPCLGEKKKLRIRYKFQNKVHSIEVDDTTGVTAPLRSHLSNQ